VVPSSKMCAIIMCSQFFGRYLKKISAWYTGLTILTSSYIPTNSVLELFDQTPYTDT